jgi:hypothetical protein
MASRKSEEMKHRLLQERDALLRQRDAIDSEIKGLERAIALVSADEKSLVGGATGRPQVKTIILDLLKDVGTTGLDATTAVAMANAKGITLDRGSVSSLLSRMKKDDIISYEGGKYRLKEFTPRSEPYRPQMPGMGGPTVN